MTWLFVPATSHAQSAASSPYGSSTGLGQPPSPWADRGGSGSSDPTPAPRLRSLAVMADVGVPDGVMMSAVFRPRSWIRLQAGAGTNTISPGLRAGATVLPFGVGPSLTLEGGWYFEGDANGLVSQFAGNGYEPSATASRIGYRFANAHLGLDFGQKYFTFFVHGGMSYLRSELHDVNSLLGTQSTSSQSLGTTTVHFGTDPTLTAFLPSLKLGFIVYII